MVLAADKGALVDRASPGNIHIRALARSLLPRINRATTLNGLARPPGRGVKLYLTISASSSWRKETPQSS